MNNADTDIVLMALENREPEGPVTESAIEQCETQEGRQILLDWQKEWYYRDMAKVGNI